MPNMSDAAFRKFLAGIQRIREAATPPPEPPPPPTADELARQLAQLSDGDANTAVVAYLEGVGQKLGSGRVPSPFWNPPAS